MKMNTMILLSVVAGCLASAIAAAPAGEMPPRSKSIDQLGAQGAKSPATIAMLTKMLADRSSQVRAHAAAALGEIGAAAKPAVPALVELLKDPDPTVRRQAVKAVMRIRPGPQVTIPLCVKLLEDADPGVRLRVLQAVAETGFQAVPGLIEALKHEKAAYWACLVLREIGPAAKDAVPALAEKLKDPQPEVRREAAIALAAMDEAAVPAVGQLAAALGDQHAHIAATYALGRIGRIPPEAEAVVRTNARSDDKMLSSTSLWALARVHPEDKELRREAAVQLIERLKDPDPFVRGRRGPWPPCRLLRRSWPRFGTRPCGMRTRPRSVTPWMPWPPSAPAVPRLIRALEHEKLRGQAVYILGEIGPAAAPATESLAKLLGDKDDRVAHEAVLALSKIGPGAKAAVPELLKLLNAPGGAESHAAAYALGKMGPAAAAAAPALAGLLQSPDANLALVGAWALVHVSPGSAEAAAKAVPVLIVGLASPMPVARRGAAEALGNLGPLAREATAALQKAAADKDPAVARRPLRHWPKSGNYSHPSKEEIAHGQRIVPSPRSPARRTRPAAHGVRILQCEFYHLRRWWWCFLILGILLVACGTAAIVIPPITVLMSLVAPVVLGVVLIVAGIATIATSLWAGKWSGLLLHLLIGILYLVAGFVITDTPLQSTVMLAAFVAALFIVGGAFQSPPR